MANDSDRRKRSIRFPIEVDEQLSAKADELDRDLSWVVIRACEHALAGGKGGDVWTQKRLR
jgi:predicted DNA-binding protein